MYLEYIDMKIELVPYTGDVEYMKEIKVYVCLSW